MIDDEIDFRHEGAEVRRALGLGPDASLADVLAEIGWLQGVVVPPRPTTDAEFDALPRVPRGLLS